METSLILLLVALLVVALIYAAPLILYRVKRKKVVIRLSSIDGKEEKIILYLKENDPFWYVIKAGKGGGDAFNS